MRKIAINTAVKKILADLYTPAGIYLRLRDRFRDTILLESTDHHSQQDSWSFICIHAIAGMEIRSADTVEFKLPGKNPEKLELKNKNEVAQLLWEFMQRFEIRKGGTKEERYAQGLFGYTSYDAVQFFENLTPACRQAGPAPLHGVERGEPFLL